MMRAMNVVVTYVSRTGGTRRAAEILGGAARALGCDVAVRPFDGLDLHELAVADAVLVGTWVDGVVLFGQRPGDRGRLETIPVLDHKPVGVFMTYAVNPGKALKKFGRYMEGKGARVVAGATFKRGDDIDADAVALVDQVLAAVPARS
jgi:hypothetical protein